MRCLLILFFVSSSNGAPILNDLISSNIVPGSVALGKLQQKQLNDALLLSCELNLTNWIAYLIGLGSNPNAARLPGGFGSSPLEIARNRSSREAVRILLGAGATNDSWTALHVAAILDQTNQILALASKGADLNEKDSRGSSPMDYALHFRNAGALVALIRSGAKHSYTPLQVSVMAHNLEDIASLSKDSRYLNRRDGFIGYTALMLAAIFDEPEACGILIRNGAELEAQTSSQGTALILAAKGNSKRAMQELLRGGADPNHVMGGCHSPLVYSVWRRDSVAVKLLLDAFANPDLALGVGLSARDFANAKAYTEIQHLMAE